MSRNLFVYKYLASHRVLIIIRLRFHRYLRLDRLAALLAIEAGDHKAAEDFHEHLEENRTKSFLPKFSFNDEKIIWNNLVVYLEYSSRSWHILCRRSVCFVFLIKKSDEKRLAGRILDQGPFETFPDHDDVIRTKLNLSSFQLKVRYFSEINCKVNFFHH